MTKPSAQAPRPSFTQHTLVVFLIALRVAIVVAVLGLNLRLYDDVRDTYRPGEVGADAREQLASLRSALEGGAAERMQARFPEGYFLTYALYGLASMDVASLLPEGDAERAQRLEDARWALDALRSDAGKAAFAEGAVHEGAYGIFYWGWRTYYEGGLLALLGEGADPALREAFAADADFVAAHFPRGATPFAQSYLGQAWPCDSVVAMAALAIHDRILSPRFARLRAAWLERATALVEPATQLFPHRVYPTTGALADGSRATSQVIIQRFLPWVDPELARAQYRTFRELFVTSRFGLPAVREYPIGVDGPGDIDSGPLLFGISVSSSTVSIGPALLHGDRGFAEKLIALGEFVGFPYEHGGEKTYAFGLLPVSDAFFLWSKLAYAEAPPGFVGASEDAPFLEAVSERWRFGLHALSVLFVSPLVIFPLIRRRRQRRMERVLGR